MKKLIISTLLVVMLLVLVIPFVSHNSVIVAKINNSGNKVAYLDDGPISSPIHPIPYVPRYPIRYVP